uniref:DNA helicase (EC) n=1 Tax=Ganoderma boninense TaxID=34458 RepID=A0A5K1K8F7_9APHY|nr:DNA helicase (EC [Ganoderma boninense]
MSFNSTVLMAPPPPPPSTTAPGPVDPLLTSIRAPLIPQTPSRPKRDENSVPWGPQRHNRAVARGVRRVSFGPLPERDDAPDTPSKPSRRPKRPALKRRNATKPTPSHGHIDGRPAPVSQDPFTITSPQEFMAMVAPEPHGHAHPEVPEPARTSYDRMVCDSA